MMNLRELFDDPNFVQSVPFSKESYKALDVILNEDDTSQDIYFILEGDVRVSIKLGGPENNLGKSEAALARLSVGDFFGELSMFDGEPRTAEVAAITDCVVAKVDGAAMIGFMDKYPERGYFVLRELFMNLVLRMRQDDIRTKTLLELYLHENNQQ